ncbi:MAG: hypothetical protein JXL80_13110 [Planctomycetes bacterium]|nr:hypothetical protein [Planctomycetota bacterium]
MRRTSFVAVLLLVCCGPVSAQEVQLDLSDGFNWDIWCGAREFQALMMHDLVDMGIDLMEMQGSYDTHNGPTYLLGNGAWLICEIDAELAEEMGCVQDSGGVYMGYAGPASWNRPSYKDGTQGTPIDGVLTGADRTYHIASHGGNATLPGDWTEVEDTTTWNLGGRISGEGLGVKFNMMCNWTTHSSAMCNDVSVTAELPDGQKGSYNNVNFVVAVMDGSNGGRQKRLWALYGTDGTDEELLFAWNDSAADLRPQMDALDPSVYEPDFKAVNTTTQYYNYGSGPTGNVVTKNHTMYEFGQPLALNPSKTLWGFKIDDSNPARNYTARGVAIWAATAFAVSGEPGRPDPVVSTVEVDPDHIPSDGSAPAVVTVTLKDQYHTLLPGLEGMIDFAVTGGGISTINFVEESSEGVYVYEFTNDTPGEKYLEVSVDFDPPEAPIVISGLGRVIVYDPADVPVADAGADMIVEDLDESGDESVMLDGSASTDRNGTIVSYVWSWYGTQLAAGETAIVTVPLGAREIVLTVTDNEGYTGSDSLWIEVRAHGYVSDLVQLDISGGFNVDSLWGSHEMKALYWYAWDHDPDLDGTEAQGYTTNANPLFRNPDIGWIVWTEYGNGFAAVVNNTRDTYTTDHQWWNPAYIDGVEGLPESGYLAGVTADYYMASSSGNPVMPGDLVEAGDDLELLAQLGPGGYAVTGHGMDIRLNTMAVGCSNNTVDWQKVEAYAELPLSQQRNYGALNCVLAAFNYARTNRGRHMRLAAVYTDDSEEIIWAWTDDADDTTPYPSELVPVGPDYNALVQTTSYYDSFSGSTGGVGWRDYALYEFAAPVLLNGRRVLKALRLYDGSPTTNYQIRGIAIFAATAAPSDLPGDPTIEVVLEEDLHWVYQNTPTLLSYGRGHNVRLTVNVLDLNYNNEVSIEVAKVDGSGPGVVTIEDDDPPSPLTKLLYGSVRGTYPASYGALVLRVTATGDRAGATVQDVPFTVRRLGDIDGNGGVEPTDFSALINALNGMPPAEYPARAYDLDANGGAEPGDASMIINILNGYPVP